ncbi:hypothetical protein FRB91_001712 [Serendipita sp. 411]|nr:hypothetical protein FRB91_001712 [Serendipita sp. 411]
MDPKTPPPRTVSLVLEDPASPPEEYSNSPPFPHTPLVRSGSPTVSRLQIGFKQPNATHLVTPTKPNIGPVTPQSTLDSSDGSHLRTPSGNFAPWNGASPDILSTPTPIGIFANMEVDKVDEEDSDEIACICKGVDDGRPMVQCDKCHTWHHVDCVGKTEEELPDKWFCWKCPMDAAPERANNVQEPTLVQSTSDYSPGVQYRSAVNMPIYQGNAASETSPTLASPSKLQKNSSLFEGQHPYGQRTPPSGASIPRYSYTPWSEEMSRHDDDPMTAIASTAFGSSSFAPSPYPQFDEMAFGSLSASPSRMIGSKFNPASISITPKKERPWTNYIGTYSTSGGSIATAGYNPFVQQSSIQADPLFIHYEHDAPKQTAHHGSKGKKRGKGKEKETSKGSVEPKEDDMSVPTSAQSEEPPKGDKMLYGNEPSLSGEENTDGLEPPANDESSMTV